MFSSCDDTYEVITTKHVERWQCKNYTMQLVTTKIPKTSCYMEEVLVNAGLSEPKQCNCRQENCSVKTSDLECTQKNINCRNLRKTALEGQGSKLHLTFKNLYSKIDLLEETVDVQFNEVELLRKVRDVTVENLNRTFNRLNVLKQKSLFANQSEINLAVILTKDICVLENHIKSKGVDFQLVKISFNSKLPIINNIKLIASVKDGSGSMQNIQFVYDLLDPQATVKAASKKILYSIWCPHHVRKRRSFGKDLGSGNDEVLSFVSWDSANNSTLSEETCITFKRTTEFLKDTIEQLVSILSQANNTLGLIEKTSQNLLKLKESMSLNNNTNTENVQTIYENQKKIFELVSTEIVDFRNRSQSVQLYKAWTESAEIYTFWNNLTVCLSFEDCIDTAIKSLEDIALVPDNMVTEYHDAMKLLKEGFRTLLSNHFENQTITELTGTTESILLDIRKLKLAIFHCSKPPTIKSSPIISKNVIKG